MSSWYSVNLGDALLAGEALAQIRTQFCAIPIPPGAPASGDRTLALFVRHQSEGRLHCEVMVYFPPAAFRLAAAANARPCRKPSPANLGLLAGSADAWSVLFPAEPG